MSAWKTVAGRCPRLAARRASMGPRRCRRGRRRSWPNRSGRSCGSGFNGATPMSAWKTARGVGRVGPVEAASMGPRRCRRGRRRGTWTPSGSPTCFNGATPMSAWKTPPRPGLNRAAVELQWGHADVGVEDVPPADATTPVRTASMGPRRCRRGRRSTMNPSPGSLASFNGATPMSAWKTRGIDGLDHDAGLASMGPRRCRRGRRGRDPQRAAPGEELQWGHADVGVEDRRPGSRPRWRGYGFNGATPMSAWKTTLPRLPPTVEVASMGPRRCRRGRQLSMTSPRRFRYASMGPRRCRRGRRRPVPDPPRRRHRFNGATPMSAWKTLMSPPLGASPSAASMGPRRCRRGRRMLAGPGLAAEKGFNGATPMSAWKTPIQRITGSIAYTLQWGHADVGVEDSTTAAARWGGISASMGPRRCRRGRRDHRGRQAQASAASMGPRRCRRGRLPIQTDDWYTLQMLQWGHADVGVEDRPRRAARTPPTGFNGATPMSAWKTPTRTRPWSSTTTRFNGATPMSAWKTVKPSDRRIAVR